MPQAARAVAGAAPVIIVENRFGLDLWLLGPIVISRVLRQDARTRSPSGGLLLGRLSPESPTGAATGFRRQDTGNRTRKVRRHSPCRYGLGAGGI